MLTTIQSTESWEQYVESYCFAAKTYYVPMADDSIPTDIQKLSNTEISYYQWVRSGNLLMI